MKHLILICCMMFAAVQLRSQILDENFDYPVDDSLGAHGWVTFSGGATNQLVVTSPGLIYPGYEKSDIGFATTILSTGQDAYKPFTAVQTTGSVYATFMVNVDSAKNSGDYFAAFLPSTNTTNFYGRVYVKRFSSGNIAFGISKTTSGSGGIFYSDSVYTTGVTYLLVVKYTFNTGTTSDDEVSLIILTSGVPSIEPAPSVGPITGTSSDPADLGRFALRQGSSSSSPSLILDGITITKDWNSALPVEMSVFNSSVSGRNVSLYWSVNSEVNNSGYEIERADNPNYEWKKICFIQGKGSTTFPQNYSFVDRSLNTGIYLYRLKQIDYSGTFQYYYLNSEVMVGVPSKYNLSQNYPNPFNPVTIINYDLPKANNVDLSLFDITGRRVMSIVDGKQEAGFYSVMIDGTGLSSGVYFYTLRTNDFSSTKRMFLVK